MEKKKASKIHFDVSGRNVQQVGMDTARANLPEIMEKLGFGISPMVARDMAHMYGFDTSGGMAMDSLPADINIPAIPGLIQFLQEWLTGQVYTMTAARKIDDLIGVTTQGQFSDEQVVQEQLDLTGYPRPYGDYTNTPYADFNINYIPRNVVRFELGMRVGILEEERSARVRVNSGQSKREACGINLEITRNLVGFFGYNSGANNTYGFLNDPQLGPYVAVANGAQATPEWSTKTFLEIQNDLLLAFASLRTQSGGNIDPKKMATVLAVPTNAIDYLSTTSDMGVSVLNWLNSNYPMVRIEDAIQLGTALGSGVGSGVFYLYPERIQDRSTDDGRVFIQPVPQRFRVLGVKKDIKFYGESYANATAGSMCKRPFLVVRFSGVS